jgi:hypothetical protein
MPFAMAIEHPTAKPAGPARIDARCQSHVVEQSAFALATGMPGSPAIAEERVYDIVGIDVLGM